VYVGRDRETGAGKGFAFVSFEDRANAQKAIDKVHGRGYDNLILSVQWSRESCLFCLCYQLNTSTYIQFQNRGLMDDDFKTKNIPLVLSPLMLYTFYAINTCASFTSVFTISPSR
jgi:RNA recognition motif-containing protein